MLRRNDTKSSSQIFGFNPSLELVTAKRGHARDTGKAQACHNSKILAHSAKSVRRTSHKGSASTKAIAKGRRPGKQRTKVQTEVRPRAHQTTSHRMHRAIRRKKTGTIESHCN